MSVQRYDIYGGHLEATETGAFMRYTDHRAELERVVREAAEQVGGYCIETFEPRVPPAEKLRGVIAEIVRRVMG